MTRALLHLFDSEASVPLDVRVVGEERRDGAVVSEIRFAAARGGDVAALVVEAEGAPAGLPGVVYAHGGTGPGKHLFAGQAVELARAGMTVLLADTTMRSPGDIEADERAFVDAVLVQRRALDVLAGRGASRFGQHGRADEAIPLAAGGALFAAAAPPKRWTEYDCNHGVDGHAPALADRIAFLRERLVRP